VSTESPTGAVQFYVDGSPYGSPVTLNDDGAALVQDADLPAGSHQITADFVPASGNFSASSAPTSAIQAVQEAATSTMIDSGPSPSVYGQSVTFGAQVTNVSPASTESPAGAVQFYVDGSPYGSPVILNADGAALIRDADLPTGSHRITADFLPANGNFSASSSPTAAIQVVQSIVKFGSTPPRPTRITGVDRTRKGLLSITVAFNEALDPGSAVEPGLFSVFGGVHKRGKTIYSRNLGIKTVSYDSEVESVTIKLARPYNGPVKLTVHAGIVADDGASRSADSSLFVTK
jgi:hypothetical protein